MKSGKKRIRLENTARSMLWLCYILFWTTQKGLQHLLSLLDSSSRIPRHRQQQQMSPEEETTICSCIPSHSCSSLRAENDGPSRAAPLCFSDYPPWSLLSPLDSLGLAATDNVKDHVEHRATAAAHTGVGLAVERQDRSALVPKGWALLGFIIRMC